MVAKDKKRIPKQIPICQNAAVLESQSKKKKNHTQRSRLLAEVLRLSHRIRPQVHPEKAELQVLEEQQYWKGVSGRGKHDREPLNHFGIQEPV